MGTAVVVVWMMMNFDGWSSITDDEDDVGEGRREDRASVEGGSYPSCLIHFEAGYVHVGEVAETTMTDHMKRKSSTMRRNVNDRRRLNQWSIQLSYLDFTWDGDDNDGYVTSSYGDIYCSWMRYQRTKATPALRSQLSSSPHKLQQRQ